MTGAPVESDTERTFNDLAAEAVELGDEHAIKICEAAIRENALRPDPGISAQQVQPST